MKRTHLWLVGLAVVFSVTSWLRRDWSWSSGFTANFGAGFLASFLTVLFIDRAISTAQEQQTKRIKSAGLQRLRPTLVSHLIFLFDLHKASASAPSSDAPTSLDDLFSDSYYESVRHMDFSRPAPADPPTTWFQVGSSNVRELTTSLDRTLDTYVAFLGAEEIELMESLRGSNIIALLPQFAALEVAERLRGRAVSGLVFCHDAVVAELRSHIRLVLSLISKVNECSSRPVSVSDLHLWRNDVAPLVGSARHKPTDA